MDTRPLYSSNTPASISASSAVQDQTEPANYPPDNEFMLRQVFSHTPQQAFTLLFRRYYPNLVNHAVRFVYSKEIAEDIVAEVFTNFWQERTFEQITTSYRAYLYTAVRHRAYNFLRWELHKSDSLDFASEQASPSWLQPDQLLHYTELHQTIESVIQKLPPQSQRAFLLSRIEGKKYAEIALELHISSSAVEKLLIRALSKLRHELQAKWFVLGILALAATLFSKVM